MSALCVSACNHAPSVWSAPHRLHPGASVGFLRERKSPLLKFVYLAWSMGTGVKGTRKWPVSAPLSPGSLSISVLLRGKKCVARAPLRATKAHVAFEPIVALRTPEMRGLLTPNNRPTKDQTNKPSAPRQAKLPQPRPRSTSSHTHPRQPPTSDHHHRPSARAYTSFLVWKKRLRCLT